MLVVRPRLLYRATSLGQYLFSDRKELLASCWCHVTLFSAYEMLSDPVKRRAFNSVDPTFDNSVPSKSEAKDNFFQVFSPVFERNSR